MITVKRYPNRKFYDTQARRYVSLGDIALLIREGKQIQVIENNTGEDITPVVLAQIIHIREKQRSTNIPANWLAQIIQLGELGVETLRQLTWQSPPFIQGFEAEVRRRINRLVQKGELETQEGEQLLKKLMETNDDHKEDAAFEILQKQFRDMLKKLEPASKNDLKILQDEIEQLTHKFNLLITRLNK